MTHTNAIGTIIYNERKRKNLTMKELADQIGVSESMISYYENGKRSPKLSTLKKLADVFSLSAQEMMFPEAPALTPEAPFVVPELDFTNSADALNFILNQNQIYHFDGANPVNLDDEGIILYANELLTMIRMANEFIAKKYSK